MNEVEAEPELTARQKIERRLGVLRSNKNFAEQHLQNLENQRIAAMAVVHGHQGAIEQLEQILRDDYPEA